MADKVYVALLEARFGKTAPAYPSFRSAAVSEDTSFTAHPQ
jgi:hypothetical protein